ncbi:MAG: hypothetical protein EBX39_11755, partial [Actinobacteria bacterium]|nr:hypothetical protein [Actinomycetota bacterium]
MITTSGVQSYSDRVQLVADTKIVARSISFSTVAGFSKQLALEPSEPIILDGANFTGLRGLSVKGSATLTGSFSVMESLAFLGPAFHDPFYRVSLASDTVLNAPAITVNGLVDGRWYQLECLGDTVFGSAVSGLARLTVSGQVSLAGDVSTLLDQVYDDQVTLAADVFLSGTSGSFSNGVDAAGHALGLLFSEDMVLDPTVFANLGGFTAGGGGTTTLVAGLTSTGTGYVTFADDVLVESDVIIRAGEGVVSFGGAVQGGGQSVQTVTTAYTIFAKPVVLRSLDVAGGAAVIGLSATDAVTIDTSDTQVFAQDAVITGTVVLTAGGGFSFQGPVTGNGGLTLRSDQTTTFDGFVLLGSLHTDAGGTTVVNTASITTTDPNTLEFGDPVILTRNTNFSAGAGDLIFRSTVDGPFALNAFSQGSTIFGGVVGGTDPLAQVATDFGGTTALDGGRVVTSGMQSYGDAVVLGADTLLSGATLRFAGTVDGAFALEANATVETAFSGAVGGVTKLASLSTDAGGTVSLQSVATSGPQRYSDDVVTLAGDYSTSDAPFTVDRVTMLAGATTVATGNGAITFGGTV